jgi:hypothetical protein
MSTALKRLHMALMLAYPPASVGGAIDGNTTNLWGAYGLAKLVGAYAGSAIRVRESGGDTETDIGFDGSGELNEAALLAHCGANSGYIVTWYDQSGGGNNLAQATHVTQPMIVDAGEYTGEILWDGTDDVLVSNASGAPTAFSVHLAGRTRCVDASARTLVHHFGTSGADSANANTQRTTTYVDDLVGIVGIGSSSTEFYDETMTDDAKVYGFRFDRSLAASAENAMFVDGSAQTSLISTGAGSTGSFTAAVWRLGSINSGRWARLAAKALLIYETAHTQPNFATIAALIAPTPPTLGLDAYTTNLWAVYSLRKQLTAYAGLCIRVRESSGNTEADVGFDADGFLDEAALLSHCGANNGFIVTWYDQSGNGNNLTQATTARQPRIVNAGALDRNIRFDGSDDYLATSASSGSVSAFTTYLRGNVEATGDQLILEHSTSYNSNNAFGVYYSSSRTFNVRVTKTTAPTGHADSPHQANLVGNVLACKGDRSQLTGAAMASVHSGGLLLARSASGDGGTLPTGNFGAHPWHLGARSGAVAPMTGDMHTVAIYEAAHTTATIERISRLLG